MQLFPAISLAVAVVGVWFLHTRVAHHVEHWLHHSVFRRRVRLVAIALPLTFPWLVNASTFTKWMNGELDLNELVRLTFVLCAAPLYVSLQALLASHSDRAGTARDEEQRLRKTVERNRNFLLDINEILLSVVGKKAVRVKKAVQHSTARSAPLATIRDAFEPGEQILAMLMAIQNYFRIRAGNDYGVRVALYRREADRDGAYLRVLCSFDGRMLGCIQTPNDAYSQHFRLPPREADASDSDCTAVAAWGARQPVIVSDTSKGHRNYKPYGQDHENRIKSIVGMALRRSDAAEPCDYVLTLDSTRSGLFVEDEVERKELEKLAENLAHRLLFEIDVAKLLSINIAEIC